MNLEEFIEETLRQIAKGVAAASDSLDEVEGAKVNPKYQRDLVEIKQIDFDVAVTTVEGTTAGAGISVWGIGAKGDMKNESSIVSRIKFKVPLQLPYDAVP